MQVLASLSKTTDGRESTWDFCESRGKYFALRVLPVVKVVPCKDRKDLQALYKTYLTPKYGFKKPVVTPDPWA